MGDSKRISIVRMHKLWTNWNNLQDYGFVPKITIEFLSNLKTNYRNRWNIVVS